MSHEDYGKHDVDHHLMKFKDHSIHGFARHLLEQVFLFARKLVLTEDQTDVLLSIVASTVSADADTWQRTAKESFTDFEKRLLDSTVERPPWSRGIFEPSSAIAINEYMLHVYYKHYKLYKYCLSSVPDGRLTQGTPGEIIPPATSKPLSEAILVTRLS